MTQSAATAPRLSLGTMLGAILLIWAASIYTTFGISAFPRQEWIVEVLGGIVFILPVMYLFKGPKSLDGAIRTIGGFLLLHSFWDALHWPGYALIRTPIDPWIPQVCPFLDILMGLWLLVRGK